MLATEDKGAIPYSPYGSQDMGGILILKEDYNQPHISKETNGRNIIKDRFPVSSGPGHPFLPIHRTVLQSPNKFPATEVRHSIKHNIPA